MPTYVYKCPRGHGEVEQTRKVYERNNQLPMCPDCGAYMHRKVLMPSVNWGGLRPSQEVERHPDVQSLLDDDERKRRIDAAR